MGTAPLPPAFPLGWVGVFAPPPQVSHGRMEPLGGGGSVSARAQSVASGWVGWSIPPRDSRSIICSCRLDSDNINITSKDDDLRVAIDHHELLVHLTDHAVDPMRGFSPNRTLD